MLNYNRERYAESVETLYQALKSAFEATHFRVQEEDFGVVRTAIHDELRKREPQEREDFIARLDKASNKEKVAFALKHIDRENRRHIPDVVASNPNSASIYGTGGGRRVFRHADHYEGPGR
jgi:hypothetical protein